MVKVGFEVIKGLYETAKQRPLTFEELATDDNLNSSVVHKALMTYHMPVFETEDNARIALHNILWSLKELSQDQAKHILKMGEDMDDILLHNAVREGDEVILAELIQLGDDVNRRNSLGNTALHELANLNRRDFEKRNSSMVNSLVEAGAEVNSQNKNGDTPLHMAYCNNNHLLIGLLESCSADKSLCNQQGHRADQMNQIKHFSKPPFEAVLPITEHNTHSDGEDIDTLVSEIVNNLMVYQKSHYLPKNVFLSRLDKKLDLLNARDEQSKQYALNKVVDREDNELGETLSHYVVRFGPEEIVFKLLDMGVDLNMKNDIGETLTHYAIRFGSQTIANDVLDRREFNLHAKTKLGSTLLHYAVPYKNFEIVSKLIDKGANPNELTVRGKTPLHHAMRYRKMSMINKLLEAGGDANKGAGTCLHAFLFKDNEYKLSKAHLLRAQYFLENYNIEVDKQDSHGNTALHLAARIDEPRYQTFVKSIVEQLVEQGASRDIPNYSGLTASDIAFQYGQDQLGQILSEASECNETQVSSCPEASYSVSQSWSQGSHPAAAAAASVDCVDENRQFKSLQQ